MISTFDLSKLKALLKDFYQLTKIRITVFDDTFHELAAYPEDIAAFCQIIRSDTQGANECHRCDQTACARAAQGRTAYTYRCHAGLTESIAPIIIGNIVIGYLLFGHVFAYSDHDAGWEKIKNLCQGYKIDIQALEESCRMMPVISGNFITSATHILQAVASFLCMDRMVSLRQQELPVRIDDYVQKHFTDDLDAAAIARHFDIGRTQLYEISRQNYGMGIAEYIRKLRIEKARTLLTEQPGLSLAEIASACGFKDYNYFITVFKKIVGIPPKAYALKFLH